MASCVSPAALGVLPHKPAAGALLPVLRGRRGPCPREPQRAPRLPASLCGPLPDCWCRRAGLEGAQLLAPYRPSSIKNCSSSCTCQLGEEVTCVPFSCPVEEVSNITDGVLGCRLQGDQGCGLMGQRLRFERWCQYITRWKRCLEHSDGSLKGPCSCLYDHLLHRIG